MERVDQDAFGEKGTCYSACLSMLMNIPFSEVPRFADMYNGDIDVWNNLIENFLEEKGFERYHYLEDQFEEVYQWMDNFEDFYFIMIGKVSRSDRNHGVIYNKRKPFHDPNPCRDFLTEECEIHLIIRKEGLS